MGNAERGVTGDPDAPVVHVAGRRPGRRRARQRGTARPQAPRAQRAVAVAWLAHPVTCLAVVALLVNDHVLKAAWGNALSGKLSDFAWLLVAPPLLATLMELVPRAWGAGPPQPRVLVAASLGAVGVVFTLVKTTEAGATAASAVLSDLAGPSVVLRDPSDLVALPVLLLAWIVALQGVGASRPSWRWMIALPVAVLATAATSYLPPPGTHLLAVLDGTLVVSEDVGSERLRWFVSADGKRWDPSSSREEDDEITARFLAAGGTLEQACVPAAPLECYRAGEGLGVDRSIDGGATWTAEWAISEQTTEELAERYRPRGSRLATEGIAIFPTSSGFEVWAVNKGDGLAVRHEDGAWERLGFPYRAEPPPVVPLPGEPTTVIYPVPRGLPVGIVAACLVLVLGSVRVPRRAEGARGRWGVALAVVGAGLAVVALVTNARDGAVVGQEVGSATIFGGFVVRVAVTVLAVLAVGLVLGGTVALRRKPFVGPMLFTVLGVTLAAELASLVLAVVVAAAVVGAAVVVARRLDSRPEPEPPSPSDYWA